MEMCYPIYDESLLSLTASILKHYGAPTPHKSLPEFDALLAKNPKNVIFMLFDGMGPTLLEQHLPAESFLRRHFVRSLSSVFPPTTTAATTTTESGLSPLEHGWLGWSLFFDEIGENVSIFPNTITESDGRKAADYHVARQYIPYQTMYDKIAMATGGEVDATPVSPFTPYKSQSVDEICRAVLDLCRQPNRQYIYTYWHQPDYDLHDLGTANSTITALLQKIDEQMEALCAKLTDTLVVITADHGLTDTAYLMLSDYPDVMDCLVRTPSLECRCMSFFIKPGRHADFERAFNSHFANCYQLLTHSEVIESNLFGAGTPHSRSEAFIGDYLAIATGLISLAPPGAHLFKAAHAGFTAIERDIPFIVVEK